MQLSLILESSVSGRNTYFGYPVVQVISHEPEARLTNP